MVAPPTWPRKAPWRPIFRMMTVRPPFEATITMPLLNMSVKHGKTQDEARSRLEMAVQEARTRFGPMIQRVEWTADRNTVTMSGVGFVIEMRVDAQEVHVTGDVPLLAGLLGSPLATSLKQIVQQTFSKPLP